MKNKLTAIKIEHDSYISLHVQLHNQLRQLIVSGRWQYGERIPSETQLSRHLNISRTTVRIALQSAELEGLITRTAGRGTFVSYEPKEAGGSRFIGYVTRSFHTEIHRVLLSSAETELRSAGHRMIFSNATDNQEEVEVLKELLDDGIVGLILWPNANPTAAQVDILQQFGEANIPIVFIDRFVDGIEADYVTSDNYGGSYALIDHLAELGHEHIVHLKHNVNNLFPIDERLRGYEAAMNDRGLACCGLWKVNSPLKNEFLETDIHELLGASSHELVEQVVELIKSTSPKPTAIACVNDMMAIIAIKALRELGLRVPEDVSVVGFDDIKLVSYMDTPLTTAAQDAHEIGRVAAQMLLDRLDGIAGPPRRHFVPTRLQIRMSTSTPYATTPDSIETNERSEYREGR